MGGLLAYTGPPREHDGLLLLDGFYPRRRQDRPPGRMNDRAERPSAGRSPLQAAADSTAATSRSHTASASSALGASTITRTSGSVPLGRTRTRPRPLSARSSRSTASAVASTAPSSAVRSAKRTLTRRWG